MDCAPYNQSLYSQYRLADIFHGWRNEHHAEWTRKCHNPHVCSTWPSSLGCEYLLAAYNKSSKIATLAQLIDKRTGTPTTHRETVGIHLRLGDLADRVNITLYKSWLRGHSHKYAHFIFTGNILSGGTGGISNTNPNILKSTAIMNELELYCRELNLSFVMRRNCHPDDDFLLLTQTAAFLPSTYGRCTRLIEKVARMRRHTIETI
jgi:hypothetical protein